MNKENICLTENNGVLNIEKADMPNVEEKREISFLLLVEHWKTSLKQYKFGCLCYFSLSFLFL